LNLNKFQRAGDFRQEDQMDESAETYDRRMAAKIDTSKSEFREFAASQNGDRWFVGRNEKTSKAYVVHKANDSSGGTRTEIEIGAFFQRTPAGVPEHEALLRLIGTLVDSSN
jgi:hypothetical protein